MSDIEKEKFRQIGIGLINEYRVRGGLKPIDWLVIDNPEVNAFIRSIQLHEKTKKELSDFRQEVSDVASVCAQHFCENSWTVGDRQDHVDMLSRFINPKPKPDPLVDAMNDIGIGVYENIKTEYADTLRADLVRRFRSALKARGLEIREKNDD